MADIKGLKNRIRSIDSTLHLTKAMGLVASAKIRGATLAMNKTRQYASALETSINALTGAKECEKSVYMRRLDTGKTCLVVIAGDRGLAGGYNSNMFKLVQQYPDAEIIPIGKRTCEKYSRDIVRTESFDYSAAIDLAKRLCDRFRDGGYSKICIAFTEYVSMMTQTPVIKNILPLQKAGIPNNTGVIYEPDEVTVLEAVIEEYVASQLFTAAREGFVCELVARRFAMDSAGKNATQMKDDLRLLYNRARQGAITQEITEIVAGSGELGR